MTFSDESDSTPAAPAPDPSPPPAPSPAPPPAPPPPPPGPDSGGGTFTEATIGAISAEQSEDIDVSGSGDSAGVEPAPDAGTAED